jgi:integrin-linked kinase-associated serine/threonine phosphatase 2C
MNADVYNELSACSGDAKCVLGRASPDGGPVKAITLTQDHKAIYPRERTRIEKAGGFVSKEGRLEGKIEVSRGFGDAQYKDAGMSAMPDIKVLLSVWHNDQHECLRSLYECLATPISDSYTLLLTHPASMHQVFEITERDKFMLLGCDGFFGVYNPDEAASATMKMLGEGRTVKNVCDRLIHEVCKFARSVRIAVIGPHCCSQ